MPSIRRAGGRRREALLAIAAAGACVLALEATLQLAIPDERTCFEHDALLGWTHRTHCTGRLRRAEFDTLVRTNGQHMRESEDVALRPDRFRVAVLGDSCAWGHGVDEDERFTELLARGLGPAYEVVNFAVTGFGPDQQLLQLERDVVPFAPRVVLVVLFLNDLVDVCEHANRLGVPKPWFALVGDRLERQGVPVPRIEGWDRGADGGWHLRLPALVARTVRPPAPQEFFNPEHVELLRDDPSQRERRERCLALCTRIVERIHDVARAHGMTLVLTEAPFREFFIPDDTLTARFHLRRADLRLPLLQQSLVAVAARLGVLYVDPYPDFVTHGGLDNFYVANQHLNAAGHARMAEVLLGGLRGSTILAQP